MGATARLSGPESPGRGGDEGRTAGSVSADRSGGVAAGTVSGGRSRGSAVPVAAELGPLDDELDRLTSPPFLRTLLSIEDSPVGRDLSGNPREGFPDAVATTDRPGAEPPAETIPGKRGRGSDADVQPEGVRTAESPGWRPDAATGAGGAGAASSRPAPVAADLNSPAGRPVDASTGEVVLSLADRPGSDAAGTGVPPDLVPAAQPRVWSLAPQPDRVLVTVIDWMGDRWMRKQGKHEHDDYWIPEDGSEFLRQTWSQLLVEYGPLTDATPPTAPLAPTDGAL
jgi:hypothetical protein